MRSTLPTWVGHWATLFGDRPAIHFEDQVVSWRQFDEEVARWRARLSAHGVRAGDRVAICLLNRPEFLYVEFAAHRIGAIVVPLNTRLAPRELAETLDDAAPAVVVYEQALAALAAYLAGSWTGGTAIDVDVPPAAEPDRSPLPTRDTDEIAALLYTSGTTGRPKGVQLTLGNLEASRTLWMSEYALTHRDVHLVVMPLCFAGGFIASSKHAIAAGATIVLVRDFDPLATLRLIERYRVSWITSVPTILDRMRASEAWETSDLTSLRGIQSGGAVVPPEMVEAYGARGIDVSQAYGLSEATGGPSMWMDDAMIRVKVGSVGRAALGFEIRLLDSDGNDVAIGEVGEIALRGPQVFPGYWGRPDLTEEVLVGGWLRTGDLAHADEDGYYFIAGRKKEMIVTGGLNVYPAEVERVVDRYPGITESAVVGVPSERWGEEIVACVVPEPGTAVDPAALIAGVRTELADYKVPKQVLVFDELPHTLSSKVQRVAVRELVVAMLAEDDR
ncbi:p-hydroxycinnamoyl-CoA synthetase [Nocardioides marmoriginsengisoli]|uniref:p-hydroxycinnamoyl-CoA synthetase n=1 Tax=Nocardioides marmoriginsengisoli TaxID=661483 RepID=A0A3N0CPH7_9ACTN|nr:AMP-binding protein [Nocardioides marmoriginsengisoli]RNL65377.1 p-hydroxycinnamoyl-CoA synthetase [Nocardioides marmoriginsengisoli]